MIGAMEAQGQVEHVIEIVGHDGEPAPVRQAIGVQGDQHARQDRENAERGPGDKPGQDFRPRMCGGMRIVAAQAIDDPPEQEGLGKLRGGDRQIGDDQRDRDTPLRPKQGKRARID